MALIGWLTDLHAHNYKQFDVGGSRLENTLSVLDHVFKYVDKHGGSMVLFSGDLYDQQKALPSAVVNAVVAKFRELFTHYPVMKFIAITGNHDQATKNTIGSPAVTAMEHLETAFPARFVLIDNRMISVEYGIVAGIPYYEYPQHFNEQLVVMSTKVAGVKGTDKAFLMMHQTPSGLHGVYANIPVDVRFDDPAFDPFDLILCGHIHGKDVLGKKFIVGGSPIHKDLGDEGEDKGFYMIDTETAEYRFISLNSKFPVFISKTEGDQVETAEQGQYIVWQPAFEPPSPEELHVTEEFKSDNRPVDLMTSFWNEVDGKDKDLLATGLSFLTQ